MLMHHYKQKAQAGVGLLEVLVALILLAIGVLGYVALQLRAMDASSEALSKSQAILVMRGLAENIRTNSTQASQYPTFVRSYSNYTSDTPAPTSCFNSLCTASQLAQFDAYQAARNANQLGMRITMSNCPGVTNTMVQQRQCLFVFWGKTAPVITTNGTNTSVDVSSCISNNGVYVNNSTCLMMEAY
ncbi:type IV pilus modification protein PilV [Acinetobacter baumannii]|uniref:Type IV pilus modification protein PilV n=2 Tax=Acinetobacter baumannii TaxID=470 RepID=A0A7X5LTS4_ACIBA|nr:type IV pilus modification protein PilV [Acinetobacter baumannii]EKV3804358.1 type IV pilus modification protein PilV [Acinetobacter baumannii]EKW1170545.1 type IV pilus modification protein PilV [Acinetobacter baumannii]EKX2699042.1 type IV pilus modification protein PilV [Acinetobacter baumannii]EKX9478448.1 type IV pilus modification protein PilV [Acinetobacter baumannii]EKY1319332.1 type IV pilus modification protein PilV [Acinetobacter baumannii]